MPLRGSDGHTHQPSHGVLTFKEQQKYPNIFYRKNTISVEVQNPGVKIWKDGVSEHARSLTVEMLYKAAHLLLLHY